MFTRNELLSNIMFGRTAAAIEVFENGELNGVHYVHVADVECNNVNDAFTLTNSIDCYWGENEGVTLTLTQEKNRSSSIGDVFVKEDGTRMLCSSLGWKIF